MRGTFGALAMCALFALPLSAAGHPTATAPAPVPAHQVTALAATASLPAAATADAAFLGWLGAPSLGCRDLCQVNSDCDLFCGAPGGVCIHHTRPLCNGCACP
jgi:hypothetical protein